MNKKALYALILAIALPLSCYLIVKQYSEDAVAMPGHYVVDTVLTKEVNGKQLTDTVWHKIPNFSLVNQLGDTVTLDSLHNKIIIADFFFTHCPTICPGMTANMHKLQSSITNAKRVGDKTNKSIFFLSFSIDPERDSVAQLKKWADRFQINPEQWWLLTGDKQVIYDLARNHMRLGVEDGAMVDTNYFHSDRFVLIDSNRYVRGYYSGIRENDQVKLARDLLFLTMEKDRTKKSFLSGKLQLLAIVFLLAAAGVGLFLIFFTKNKTQKDVSTRVDKE